MKSRRLQKARALRSQQNTDNLHLPCDESVSDGDSGGVEMVDSDESVESEDDEQDEEEDEGIILCILLRLGNGFSSRWIKLSFALSMRTCEESPVDEDFKGNWL